MHHRQLVHSCTKTLSSHFVAQKHSSEQKQVSVNIKMHYDGIKKNNNSNDDDDDGYSQHITIIIEVKKFYKLGAKS